MPPKGSHAKDKNASPAKKAPAAPARPAISDSDLVYTAADAVEGFQERIESCVEWTLMGKALKHHKRKCEREHIPKVSFWDAFQSRLNMSMLTGFLDKNSSMTLEDHWDVILPMKIFDKNNSDSEESKICFEHANNLTDKLNKIIKKAVRNNNRDVLMEQIYSTDVLRLIDCKMTYIDESIKMFPNLIKLSLCGNYLSAIDGKLLPNYLRMLELQANRFKNFHHIIDLPRNLLYIGLSKNLISSDLDSFTKIPYSITVLDLSDNDICDLMRLLYVLAKLPNLFSLQLIGNPCSFCAAYAVTTVSKLPRLRYLDNRQVLAADRPAPDFEPHPDDLRSAYFHFTVLRIMSAPMPPKHEKGANGFIHVEFELPLMDAQRRAFLMFRRAESLSELLPLPEDDGTLSPRQASNNPTISKDSKTQSKDSKFTHDLQEPQEADPEELGTGTLESNIFNNLIPKTSRLIHHYNVYESNHVQWSKLMNFQEPTFRIFCPDLKALRDTFRSVITIRVVYSLITTAAKKHDKRSQAVFKSAPPVQHVTLATIKCSLRNPDWSQSLIHFHWDEAFHSQEALDWGVNDLAVLPYQLQSVVSKDKSKTSGKSKDKDSKNYEKLPVPETFTCQFSFGIETIHAA